MLQLGAKLSKPFKKRAIVILEHFAKKFNLSSLIMGMGGSSLKGGACLMQDRDNPNETYTVDDIGDHLLDAASSSYGSIPVGWDDNDAKLANELQEILWFLSDEPYFEIFDWQAK